MEKIKNKIWNGESLDILDYIAITLYGAFIVVMVGLFISLSYVLVSQIFKIIYRALENSLTTIDIVAITGTAIATLFLIGYFSLKNE